MDEQTIKAQRQDLGSRLRARRLARRLSMLQVAASAGVAEMTVRGLERGALDVHLSKVLAVVRVLGFELVLVDAPPLSE